MKNFTILLACMLATATSFAQNRQYTEGFDARVGVGKTVILGDVNESVTVTEAEVNYKMCPFITYNLGVNYATNRNETEQPTSYYQGNANLFLSPFKNTGKMDFRIGGGLSYSRLDTYRAAEIRSGGTVIGQTDPIAVCQNGLGYNFIVENTFSLGKHFIFGVKGFTQRYKSVQNNRGVVLKLGVNL